MKKVENFDEYTVLARPLPEREQRILPCSKNYNVDYGSFQLALAEGTTGKKKVILVENGLGKFVFPLESDWIAAAPLLALAESDPAGCYALLFSLYKGQDAAYSVGYTHAAKEYRVAFAAGRLKKRKQRGSDSVKIWIEPERAVS